MLCCMAEFPTNPTRLDPYKNFKFRVKWDGQYVPAILRVSELVHTTEVVELRAGGDPSTSHKSTGLTQFMPITLERGLTDDPAFENWANLVWQVGGALGAESSLNKFRKDITIELYNEAGQLVRAYHVLRCWPSEYQAMSQLDANVASTVIERLVLQNEGWERDTSVVPPVQT
jgi:phage tail-like protein